MFGNGNRRDSLSAAGQCDTGPNAVCRASEEGVHSGASGGLCSEELSGGARIARTSQGGGSWSGFGTGELLAAGGHALAGESRDRQRPHGIASAAVHHSSHHRPGYALAVESERVGKRGGGALLPGGACVR